MERYLTNKGKRNTGWEIPAVVASAIVGAASIEVAIEDFFTTTDDKAISILAYAFVLALVFAPLFLAVRRWLRRLTARRLARALAACPDDELPLDQLARDTGMPKAGEQLRKLLRLGFLCGVTVDETRQCVRSAYAPAPSPRPEPVPTVEEDEFAPILREIRRLNDDIEDEAVSARIDRIEAVTASISAAVREAPERAEKARRFVNYYLPTTLRLLRIYALMEDQSFQGANIRASRKNIEEVLEKLVRAAELQQDKLFQNDAMDVDAEIRALETMLAVDGLGPERLQMRGRR